MKDKEAMTVLSTLKEQAEKIERLEAEVCRLKEKLSQKLHDIGDTRRAR